MTFKDLLQFLGFKGVPRVVRQPAGHTRTTGPYGELVDADALQCCHCGAQWEVVAGSDRERGFCRKCMGYVCGHPVCMTTCVPYEQRLDNVERGLHPLTPSLPQVVVPNLPAAPKKLIIP